MHRPGLLSIWFFIGTLLLLYGIIIFATGLSELHTPPPVVLTNLHAPIWWGILLIALGAFYFVRFGPWHKS